MRNKPYKWKTWDSFLKEWCKIRRIHEDTKYRWGKNKLFLCKINRYKVNPSNTSSSWICPVRTGNIPLKVIFLLEIRIRYCWVSYISYCNICSMVVIRLFNYTLDNNKLQSGDNSLFITLKIWFIFIYAKPKSLLQGLDSITQRVFKTVKPSFARHSVQFFGFENMLWFEE